MLHSDIRYVLNTCHLSRPRDTVIAAILAHENGFLANKQIRDKACYAQTVIIAVYFFIIEWKKLEQYLLS